MNKILEGKGLVKIAEDTVHVTGLKGPLEEGWQHRVEDFVARLPPSQPSASLPETPARGNQA
jgi:hypothetical protein